MLAVPFSLLHTYKLMSSCRRKMNRESARRTRLRKQQQVTSLKEEVGPHTLCSLFPDVLL